MWPNDGSNRYTNNWPFNDNKKNRTFGIFMSITSINHKNTIEHYISAISGTLLPCLSHSNTYFKLIFWYNLLTEVHILTARNNYLWRKRCVFRSSLVGGGVCDLVTVDTFCVRMILFCVGEFFKDVAYLWYTEDPALWGSRFLFGVLLVKQYLTSIIYFIESYLMINSWRATKDVHRLFSRNFYFPRCFFHMQMQNFSITYHKDVD